VVPQPAVNKDALSKTDSRPAVASLVR